MKIQPIADQIVIEPQKVETKTKSGIIFSSSSEKEKPQQGKVVAIGPGKMLENGSRAMMQVKVGDTVLFAKYSPTEIKVEGKEYFVIKEDDVMVIIK